MQKDRFKSFLLSPYVVALFAAAVIAFFIPDMFSKYKIHKLREGTTRYQNQIILYDDLDADGNSDVIHSFIAQQGFHCIQVFDHEGGVIDQWNLDGILPGNDERLVAGDYDNDGIREVFVFCQTNDSIFLYAFEPVEKAPFFIHHRFIARLSRKYAEPEYSMHSINLIDMNNNGHLDLVFVISSGFSIQPRQIYIYDIVRDSLISSEPAGSIIGKFKFYDLNGDGYPEIMGNSGASGNVNDSLNIPFSDYNAWLRVFNHTLDHLFPPVKYPGMHSMVKSWPVRWNDTAWLLSYYQHTGSSDNIPLITLRDHRGKIRLERSFGKSTKQQVELYLDEAGIWLIRQDGRIKRLRQDLSDADSLDLMVDINIGPFALDLDSDGKEEIILLKRDLPEAIILRKGFREPVDLELPEMIGGETNQVFSVIQSRGLENALFIQRGKNFATYTYGFNNLNLLRFPVYLVIYGAIFLFILLIRKIQRIQIREKMDLRNQIAGLQLKTINNQLDPHFTLNAFNAIAGLLKKEKGDVAYDHFVKFSNLVRANLVSADQIARTLEDELNTVRNYLDIQKLRFRDQFEYRISVQPSVNTSWKIPKMTIQNYAENAVKHGLRHRPGNGLLSVDVRTEEKHLVITVEDNGIGRDQAAEMTRESTGMGMQLMEHYFSLLNQYNHIKIEQEITDLFDDADAPAGTRVVVHIPVDLKFRVEY
jgi:hypothetical protein